MDSIALQCIERCTIQIKLGSESVFELVKAEAGAAGARLLL